MPFPSPSPSPVPIMAHTPQHSDRTPAFTGLIVGALLTAAILYGTVQWTNAQFAGHEAPAGSAAQTP